MYKRGIRSRRATAVEKCDGDVVESMKKPRCARQRRVASRRVGSSCGRYKSLVHFASVLLLFRNLFSQLNSMVIHCRVIYQIDSSSALALSLLWLWLSHRGFAALIPRRRTPSVPAAIGCTASDSSSLGGHRASFDRCNGGSRFFHRSTTPPHVKPLHGNLDAVLPSLGISTTAIKPDWNIIPVALNPFSSSLAHKPRLTDFNITVALSNHKTGKTSTQPFPTVYSNSV